MIAEKDLIKAIDSIDLAINPVIGDLVSKEMIPLWESEAAARDEGKKHTITLDYGNNCKVDRVITYHDGKVKKESYPKHFKDNKWIKSLPEDRNLFPLYQEKFISIAKGKWLSFHEGEKASDYALSRGLISSSLAGSLAYDENYHKNKLIFIKELGIKGIAYFADNDEPGIKKAIKIRDICLSIDLPCVIIPIGKILWTAKKGDDFKEYSDQFPHHNNELLKEQIESNIIESKYEFINIKDGIEDTVQSDSKKNKANNEAWFNIATEDLFSGHWISLNNVLYKFNGQYYEETKDGENKRKINNWCSNYIDENGKKTKATPANVENVFKWVNQKFYVSPDKINCEGIPLKNGYLSLTINKETNKPKFELKPYHHDVYFTYQSEVKYDPKASSESAIKLLECLDEPYKSLFIKSVSTVLGFKEIRKKWDRIKALLLIGDGSNGKDTLREVISLILGEQGITSCSLNDFSQSRGFNIARLATNPKLNWSSENKEINIDSIQSLKQAITGDPLYLEGKGKDGFEVKLNTLFIFNSNHQPDLKGNQFAIQSRLTLIPFTKTYSMTPKRGELKADPRFKHDKEFLVNDVAVGFLNLLIKAFGDVYSKGIDYQESEQYFNEVIEENNHLRRFAKEIGLTYTGDESDRLTIGDIYSHLLEYYFEHGYLEIEETSNGKRKNIWLDDDKRDPVIKNGNKLKPRILELFPKAKERTISRKIYLCGLKIDLTHVDSPQNAETTDNKGVDAPHVDSHSDSHSDSFYTHSQTHIDSPPPKNDSLFNQKSGCEQSHTNKTENNQSESTSEPKVSQEVSQKVSQQKAENPNKNNGFKNQGESTAKNNVSQKNENSFDDEHEEDLWASPSEDDKSDNSEILKEKFMIANGIFSDEELVTAINLYSQTKFNSVSDIPNHVYLDLLGGYQEQST